MSLPANVDCQIFQATDEYVQRKVEEMNAAGFPNGSCIGIFMGVRCDHVHLVPVRRKETSPPDASSRRDFHIEDWVPCNSYSHDNLPPLPGEYENTRVLGQIRPADEDDSNLFVIFWEAQGSPYLLVNDFVDRLCNGRAPQWYGGVLVLKTDRKEKVEDMTEHWQDREIAMRMVLNSVWATVRVPVAAEKTNLGSSGMDSASTTGHDIRAFVTALQKPTTFKTFTPVMAKALQKEILERIELTAGTSNTAKISASETKFVKQAILEVEEKIDALNAEIAQRTARLQRLQAAIAPHKRLPLEILTHIFMYTLEIPEKHPDDNWYLEIPLIRDAPWSLRQVCSSWRQAALKYYPLWSRIRVGQPDEDSDGELEVEFSRWCDSLDLVHNILPPSGPLSLSIFPPSDEVVLIEAAIDTLVIPYLPRISSLQFACTSFSGLDKFFTLPENSLAEMKVLKLDCIQADEDSWSPTTSNVFIGAKNLRDISLSGSRKFCDSILGAQEVPWGQLIHLTLALDSPYEDSLKFNLKYSTVLPVLSKCQNLVSLTLIFTEDAESLTSPQLHVILPTLKKLNLTILDPYPLTRFTLPSLIDLRIDRACAFPTSELRSMIKRSSCRLKKFVEVPQYDFPGMDQSMDYASGVIDLYRSLESLEYLCGSLKFSRGLVEEVASGQILPSLQTFYCRFETSTEAFLVALKPRLGWKDPLQVSYTGIRSVVGYIDECEDTDGKLIDEARIVSRRILAGYATNVSFRYWYF